jgi:hypothetical protein
MVFVVDGLERAHELADVGLASDHGEIGIATAPGSTGAQRYPRIDCDDDLINAGHTSRRYLPRGATRA